MRHGHWNSAPFGRGDGDLGDYRHGRGFGRGRGGWERHRRRMFDQGELRLVILRLLSDRPSHGYEIIKAIEEALGGEYTPSPGVIYPTLTLLEEMGLATMEPAEGGRKLYAITDAGRAYLETHKTAADDVAARMAEMRGRSGDLPLQVLRAMENLRAAVRLRLSREKLSEPQAQALADALDSAAHAIERI